MRSTAAVSFQGYQLGSAYQPVFALNQRRVVGFEALIRGFDDAGDGVSPAELFQAAATPSEVIDLDALCQQVHIQNFAHHAPADRWLFLNIDTASLTNAYSSGQFITRVAGRAGLPLSRLVIEITESPTTDDAVLAAAVDHFRALGTLVALDDFGAGHSNFDRIWRLTPDIVKLDRSLIAEAARHRTGKLRRMLRSLVALMHEAGCLVLVEGIETEEQAFIALDADVDFLQGFYLARPGVAIKPDAMHKGEIDRMLAVFHTSASAQDLAESRLIEPYLQAFRIAARRCFEQDETFAQLCRPLLSMQYTARCYLLDEKGEGIAHVAPPGRRKMPDTRYFPINDAMGGAWFCRSYFRRALKAPMRVRISRPYLSTVGPRMCVTLSMASENDPRQVFCCDLRW